jgi:hypothetical protein
MSELTNGVEEVSDRTVEEKIIELIEVEEPKEQIEEPKEQIEEPKVKTLLHLFETFLIQNQSNLVNIDLKLTTEIRKYFLLLCKENPKLFGSVEETFKVIFLDNKIDIKDIPEMMVIVSKVYNIIKDNRGIPTVDPYNLIKIFLYLIIVIYLESNKVENEKLLLDLLKIVESSIDLIKLTPIFTKKISCFFNCK